jgi:hypothetical protein
LIYRKETGPPGCLCCAKRANDKHVGFGNLGPNRQVMEAESDLQIINGIATLTVADA